MRTWKITGILAVLIIGFLTISGCTQDNSKYCADNFPGTYYNPSTKMCEHTLEPTPFPTSTFTPKITVTNDRDSIQTQIKNEWGQIRDVYDAYIIEREKNLITSYEGTYQLRHKTIPNTISEYQKIKNDLLTINIANSDLQKERAVLVSICEYKIKYLEGVSWNYIAMQDETVSPQSSLSEYKDAKLAFRDEQDIINDIPYSSKYWDYIYDDDQIAKTNVGTSDENILRMSKLVK